MGDKFSDDEIEVLLMCPDNCLNKDKMNANGNCYCMTCVEGSNFEPIDDDLGKEL